MESEVTGVPWGFTWIQEYDTRKVGKDPRMGLATKLSVLQFLMDL